MTVKQLTEHYLEYLSVKGGCTSSSEYYTCQNATLEITFCGSIIYIKPLLKRTFTCTQGLHIYIISLHRLEKYLNIQDCLEKSLKIKFALKST